MKLFDALRKMRELTAQGRSFSFSFMSFNSTTHTSEGRVCVTTARLRKRVNSVNYRNADYLIAYQDLTNNEARQFYFPLLMDFNGEKIEIR
ncbi:MAG: hypothetical protein ACRDDZ_05845 [Marinifilaceae bacterium]